MDYEKAYKELLERGRKFRMKYIGDVQNGIFNVIDKSGEIAKDFDNVFPELKESKDEILRRRLIGYLEQDREEYPNRKERIDEMIAWLVKLPDFEAEIEKAYKNSDAIQYKKGFEDGVASVKSGEWNEEDEMAINDLMWCIDAYRKGAFNEMHIERADRAENWLKSLRPHPHWKPSEEQMEALKDAFRKDGGNEYRKVINSLYCDLQKLL